MTDTGTTTRHMLAWAMYDWASNAYAAIVLTFVFAAYFTERVVGDAAAGTAVWGILLGVTGVFVALGGPLVGATADHLGRRKPLDGAPLARAPLSRVHLARRSAHRGRRARRGVRGRTVQRDAAVDRTALGIIVPGGALLIIESDTLFWVLAMLLGIFVGPVQAGSRSLLSRVAPEELRHQMFGLYALSGKVAFFCPLLVALLTWASGSQRVGMSAIVLFMAIGFAIMLTVPDERHAGAAEEAHAGSA